MIRFRHLLILALVITYSAAEDNAAGAQESFDQLLTRAEATDFIETSSYEDVMAFAEALAAGSDEIHLTNFGYTNEGRRLPLLVLGAPATLACRYARSTSSSCSEHQQREQFFGARSTSCACSSWTCCSSFSSVISTTSVTRWYGSRRSSRDATSRRGSRSIWYRSSPSTSSASSCPQTRSSR